MSEELEKIIEVLRNDGTKNGFNKQPKVLIRAARVLNKANKFEGKEGIIEEEFQGHSILRSPKKNKKALFAIHGGGYLFTATPLHIERSFKLGEESGRDVIFPIYPTLEKEGIEGIIEFLVAAYEREVSFYGAANVAIAGYSAGGSAGLLICNFLNERGKRDLLPELLIALSPGIGVETVEELNEMRMMEDKDIQIPLAFYENFGKLIGDVLPVYGNPLLGDFSGVGKVYFNFGGDEIAVVRVDALKRRIEELGVDANIIVGDGLFHCYPLFTGAKELEVAFNNMIEILKY